MTELMPDTTDDPGELASFYERDGDGFRLSNFGREVKVEHGRLLMKLEREMIDTEQSIEARVRDKDDDTRRTWTRVLFRREVESAIRKLRIPEDLRDVAQKNIVYALAPLTVVDPELPVMVASPEGPVSVIDAVQGWLMLEESKPFRPEPAVPKVVGIYAKKLAELKLGIIK